MREEEARKENSKEDAEEDGDQRRKKSFPWNSSKKIHRKRTEFQTVSFSPFSFRR
jgi:hypothetical protein